MTYRPKLYVITTKDLVPTKIGVSLDVTGRLKQIQTSCWEKLILYRVFDCEPGVGFNMESLLKKEFKLRRLQGEWYDVPADMMVEHITKTLREH